MTTGDDNDLTDRYNAITGNTLEDDWKENPNPPPSYGKPDGQTIVETVAGIVWVWHTHNSDAEIKFEGNSVSVKDER